MSFELITSLGPGQPTQCVDLGSQHNGRHVQRAINHVAITKIRIHGHEPKKFLNFSVLPMAMVRPSNPPISRAK